MQCGRKMSCDSWEEAVPSAASSSTTSTSPKPPLPPELVVSDANVDADSAGLLMRLRGGLAILFVVGIWVAAVSKRFHNTSISDAHRTTVEFDTSFDEQKSSGYLAIFDSRCSIPGIRYLVYSGSIRHGYAALAINEKPEKCRQYPTDRQADGRYE